MEGVGQNLNIFTSGASSTKLDTNILLFFLPLPLKKYFYVVLQLANNEV